jgi:hypothetical protein
MQATRRRTYFFIHPGVLGKDPFEGKHASYRPPRENLSIVEEDAVPLRHYAGQYWWIEVHKGNKKGGMHKAISTEQIAEALDRGDRVVAIRGPYPSLREVSNRMEDYWEAIMGDDDD